jgi:hypothetical protein
MLIFAVTSSPLGRGVRADVLVNNVAYKTTHGQLEDTSDEGWEYTFKFNVSAMFHLVKAALRHMGSGS